MGWNFGGAVIDFDYRTLLATLPPERRRPRYAHATPEDILVAETGEAGEIALAELDISFANADAPVSFDDATSRYFDDYAVGIAGGKTVVLGRELGLLQGDARSIETCQRVSRERGQVLTFWFNDASGSYMFSVFRDGARVRFRSRGPDMDDEAGAPLPGEPAGPTGPHDHQLALLDATLGRPFFLIHDFPFERFDAVR